MMNVTEETVKRVRAAIESEPRVNLQRSNIEIDVRDGALCVVGGVDTIATRKLVLRLAQQGAGLDSLYDNLRVMPASLKADGEILETLTNFLLQETDLKNCSLRRIYRDRLETVHEVLNDDRSGDIIFSAIEGVISLEGHVISLSHRRIAEVLAWWVPGCSLVNNHLAVEPAEDDNDDEITDAVRLVLELDATLHADQIGVVTCQGEVKLNGVVNRQEERAWAELDTWYVPGVNEVINRIEVRR